MGASSSCLEGHGVFPCTDDCSVDLAGHFMNLAAMTKVTARTMDCTFIVLAHVTKRCHERRQAVISNRTNQMVLWHVEQVAFCLLRDGVLLRYLTTSLAGAPP